MTKKRWIVVAGILAACVCLTLGVLAMLPPRPGVTPANIERIEDGMTLAEVEKILGGPGPDFISGRAAKILAWNNPHYGTWVHVVFDCDNRVIGKVWESPETFLQRVQRLLHL
jgi:hypothetical protein